MPPGPRHPPGLLSRREAETPQVSGIPGLRGARPLRRRVAWPSVAGWLALRAGTTSEDQPPAAGPSLMRRGWLVCGGVGTRGIDCRYPTPPPHVDLDQWARMGCTPGVPGGPCSAAVGLGSCPPPRPRHPARGSVAARLPALRRVASPRSVAAGAVGAARTPAPARPAQSPRGSGSGARHPRAVLDGTGSAAAHPFRGSRLSEVVTADRDQGSAPSLVLGVW